MNTQSKIAKTSQDQMLAHMLNHPKHYVMNSHLITDDLFSNSISKRLFRGFEKVMLEGGKVDVVRVVEASKGSWDINYDHLTNLVANISYETDFETYLAYALEGYKQLKLQHLLARINERVEQGEETEGLIKAMEVELFNIKEVRESTINDMATNLKIVFDNIDKNASAKGLVGIGSGFKHLDDFTGGWQRSDLVIIAADTSQGKTSFALNCAKNAAIAFKHPVAIYSLEMSALQLSARLMSMESNINSKSILRSKLSTDEISQIHSSLYQLSEAEIYIDDCPSNLISYIMSSIRTLRLQKNIEFAVVDYLQLVGLGEKGVSREQEVGKIARMLKNLAKELNIAIMVLSQLNRGQSSRSGGEPRLSDLRDSGQIEEAADTVILLYRPEVYGVETYGDGSSTSGIAEIKIAKGRNIGLSTILLNFEPELTRFSNYDKTFVPY